MTELIKNTPDEFVIAIDGKWGEGKTTFVKMWQSLLEDQKIPCIYFDAFENDFTHDPLLSIASAINSYIKLNLSDEDLKNTFKQSMKNILLNIVPITGKVALKHLIGNAIEASDLENLTESKGDIVDKASSSAAKYLETKLESYFKEKEVIQKYKELLSQMPKKFENNSLGKLIVIVDELDRCRPSYAVEVLEKIKHLFSVRHVVFVLVMNKEQMEESIRCVYGLNIDAHAYLQKFVQLETKITTINFRHGNQKINYEKYSNSLLKKMDIPKNIIEWSGKIFSDISMNIQLSLREMERAVWYIKIFYISNKNQFNNHAHLMIFISILKTKKPLIFNAIHNKNLDLNRFYNELDTDRKLRNLIENFDKNNEYVINNDNYIIAFFGIISSDDSYKGEDMNKIRLYFDIFTVESPVFIKNLLSKYCSQINDFQINQ